MALSYFDQLVGGVNQLWVTDGTSAGTHLVAAFGAGTIANLTAIGSRIFFTVDDGVHGSELWTSDGTIFGTYLVKDIDPGASGSEPTQSDECRRRALLARLTTAPMAPNYGSRTGLPPELSWSRTFNPGPYGAYFYELTNVSGALYFGAYDGAHGYNLWKSDGTAAGT